MHTECNIPFRGMKKRDFLLRRYWRREDDGTYGNNFQEKSNAWGI